MNNYASYTNCMHAQRKSLDFLHTVPGINLYNSWHAF